MKSILALFNRELRSYPSGYITRDGLDTDCMARLLTGDEYTEDADSSIRRSCELMVERGLMVKTYGKVTHWHLKQCYHHRRTVYYKPVDWFPNWGYYEEWRAKQAAIILRRLIP